MNNFTNSNYLNASQAESSNALFDCIGTGGPVLEMTSDDERNRLEAQQVAKEVIRINDLLTPKNTKVAYVPKQRAFIEWCLSEKRYSNGASVTEAKVLLWLKHVTDIGNTKKKVDGKNQPLGKSAIQMHTKALVNLWRRQLLVMPETTSIHHPRGPSVKLLESNLIKACHEVKKDKKKDTGVHSCHDGYNQEQFVELSMYYFKKRAGAQCNFRDRMMILVNHAMLLRGESLRSVCLEHCSFYDFPGEGETACPALVFQLTEGKMNQSHDTLYSGAIRHIDVKLCAVAATAFYFFYRYHIEEEDFPTFTENKDWYGIRVLKSAKNSNRHPVSYDSQYKSIRKAFDVLNIVSSNITHVSRACGARIAESNGTTLDDIRRMGRWDNGSLEKSYLTHLPKVAIRICNGHPKTKGTFWLPRAGIDPPLELQEMIFPEADIWLSRLQDPESPAYKSSISGLKFLEMLIQMRIIILQDAVLLRIEDPANVIFGHPIFRSALFEEFSRNLLNKMDVQETPASLRLNEVLPFVEKRFCEIVADIKQKNAEQLLLQESAVNRLQDRLVRSVLTTISECCRNANQSTSYNNVENPQSSAGITSSSLGADTSFNISSSPLSTHTSDNAVSFSLSKDISTVRQLWDEWHNTGSLSTRNKPVVELNRLHRSKWRSSQKARAFYCRRLSIIKKVTEKAQEENLTIDEAIRLCDKQKYEWNCKSLNAYSLKLGKVDKPNKISRKGKERATD